MRVIVAGMAKKTIVEVLSDLSGKPDAVTVFFSWQGVAYEVDLTPDEAAKIEKALTPVIEVSRRASKPSGSRGKPNRDTAEVRAWAEANGLVEPGGRGRLPNTVWDAWANR